MQRTPNLGLPQFEPTDKYRLEDYNEAYMKIDEKIKELKDKEAQLDTKLAEAQSIIDTWTQFKNNGGAINGTINVNDANLNGSLNFSGILNNTDLKTENKKIFDVKRDTGDQIYFGNGSLKMVLDAKEFNAYGAFNCHSGINIPNNSISSIGYTKLPNGLIMQWGSIDVSVAQGSHVSTVVTLPIAFSKNIVTCCSSVSWNSTDNSTGWLDNYTSNVGRKALTNINVIVKNVAGSPGTKKLNVGWIALGY